MYDMISSQKFTEDTDDILIGLYSDGGIYGWNFHKLLKIG